MVISSSCRQHKRKTYNKCDLPKNGKKQGIIQLYNSKLPNFIQS